MESDSTTADTSGSTLIGCLAALLLLAFYLGCVAGPVVLLHTAGPWWAIACGIVLPAAWLRLMPTSCMNGGLIWSMLGIHVLLSLVAWTGIGLWTVGLLLFA